MGAAPRGPGPFRHVMGVPVTFRGIVGGGAVAHGPDREQG